MCVQSISAARSAANTCLPHCAQIYAIYDYQVAFNVRLATENPYVPTFGSDIPGGPPGLGVSLFSDILCQAVASCAGAVSGRRCRIAVCLVNPLCVLSQSSVLLRPPAVPWQVDYFDPTTPSPPVVTATVMTGAPVTTSGVKIGAPLDLTGLYTVPVKITNATRSTVRLCRVGTWYLLTRTAAMAVPAMLWWSHGCMPA